MKSYIQKLIDSQENIIIICDNKFNIKYINSSFYDYFKKERVIEIVELVKKKKFDEEFKVTIKNYKLNKYTFLVKIAKIENDISITFRNITKVSAYKKSLLHSNYSFLEYRNIVDKFLIISKTDRKGYITFVNDNFVKISGYQKEELIGKPHNLIRHQDMPSYVFKNMWKTIEKGDIWQGVIKNRKKNGETYYVKTIVAPLFNRENKIKEYIALRIDITELIKAKELAQGAKRAKEIFLANMSHEIRTPLTGIIGFIDVLKKKELSDEVKKIINIIDTSADSLHNIVNDILDLSKIETEGVTIHKHKFNPKVSFENTIQLFLAKAKEKNINYLYNIDLDECIISDEHRLKQVLSNLIGNSIKFTPENGEVKVSISSIKQKDKLIVNFSVEDNGIGIPKEKQNQLFKLFSQIDNSSDKFGGTGLGLYISAQIVQKLGGKLQVESEKGKGSKFYFSLEFEECENLIQVKEKEIRVTGKILIAEDNIVNQELLKAVLKMKGDIEIEIVNNGKEAVEIFKKEKFDMIFMDIFMPIMDGSEATKLILEFEKENNRKHTPIVALTANVLSGDKEKFLSEGFDDYVAKPIKNKDLDRVLNNYLKKGGIISTLSNSMNLDEEFIVELVNLYFKNIYNDLSMLKDAIQSKNFDEIRKVSHKIAGSSGAVHLDDIYKLAKNMENLAKENKQIDYNNLFNKIKLKIQEYHQEVDL